MSTEIGQPPVVAEGEAALHYPVPSTIPVPPTTLAKNFRPNKSRRGKRLSPEAILAKGNGKWTEEEHKRFLKALEMYGNCWKRVEEFVGTRSCAQIRSHCQKYFRRLRNKALQELRRSNQLHGKVFIVTKEYFNYSGCTRDSPEEEPQTPAEPGSTKTEEAKDVFPPLTLACEIAEEMEQKLEGLEDPAKERNECNEAVCELGFGLYDEAAFPVPANELAFGEDYEERDLPFLARVPYEA